MQGHIGDPEVSLGVNGESVGHVELWLPPRTLRSTNAGEFEQRRDLDWSIILVTIREVKVEGTASWNHGKVIVIEEEVMYIPYLIQYNT